ncbi:MAG: hypothetical protein DRJ59_00365 [Thermoprotei archaeon]|nr:MAG: hypothetical protein DRJ59_00365 [Thermoprotei archaeon]
MRLEVLKVAFLVSVVLNAFLGTIIFYQYVELAKLRLLSEELAEKVNDLLQRNAELEKRLQSLLEENNYLKHSLARLLNTTATEGKVPANLAKDYDWIPIVGVYIVRVGFLKYVTEGVVMKIYVKVVPGTGKVFISTTPRIGIDLQSSAVTALKVALNLTNSKVKYDCFIVVQADKTIHVIDGPSAGAALTILIMAKIMGLELRKDVCITGEILQDGRIGPVGGILEKALAAASHNIKIFLVPKGQGEMLRPLVISRKVAPGVTIYQVKGYVRVPLEEVLRERGYDMKVIEVSTVREALQYFLKPQ